MNRRNFIKTGTLLLSVSAIAKISSFGSTKLFAMESEKDDFSIELITDNGEKAIPEIEKLIKENIFTNGIVKYSEYEMTGTQKGDIVYFKNGKLINYKNDSDKLSQKIKEISNDLNLPKIIENPQKIRFYTQSIYSNATKYIVIHNGTIIEELKPTIPTRTYNITGSIGNMNIRTRDNKLRVRESSCQHKTCVKSGSIAKSGEYIVCIPNEIVIMAE
jgi:hypothetical protein